VAYKRLVNAVGMKRVMSALPEKTFIKDFPNRIVYLGKVRGPELKDVLIYNLDKQGKVDNYIRAAEGRITTEGLVIHLQLLDAWRVGLVDGKQSPAYAEESVFSYTNLASTAGAAQTPLTDMTFGQVRAQLTELERQLASPIPISELSTEQMRTRLAAMREQRKDLTLPIKVQMHRQVAFSLASIGFTLLGIPLGIRAHRRETLFGIVVALLLVLAYYSFFILGQSLDGHPEYFPHLILWVPNFLFQALGLVLLRRANRGI
jgi:lipopolysaccharide export system permease protein